MASLTKDIKSRMMLSRMDLVSNVTEPPTPASAPVPSPVELSAFLPYACRQLQAPFLARIVLHLEEAYRSKTDSKKLSRTVMQSQTSATTMPSDSESLRTAAVKVAPMKSHILSSSEPEIVHKYIDYEIVVHATHNAAEQIVALALRDEVPRLLVKMIGLCLPFHPQLTRLTAIRIPLLAGAVVHELAQLLPGSRITELYLDGSPVPECNQYLLLECGSGLRTLSLNCCQLGDAGVERLADELAVGRGGATLVSLSLATNRASDVAAEALAAALRTNRTLQHLNLADNCITDRGAAALFEVLAEFPLTDDESAEARRRSLDYFRLRREVYARCFERLVAEEQRRMQRLVTKRATAGRSVRNSRSTPSLIGTLTARAQDMTQDIVGAHTDPFGPQYTVHRGGRRLCCGNLALCYLNLAYNHLTYFSVRELARVVTAQEKLIQAKLGCGVVRVILDGNPLPASCAEADQLQTMLDLQLDRRTTVATNLSRSRANRSRIIKR